TVFTAAQRENVLQQSRQQNVNYGNAFGQLLIKQATNTPAIVCFEGERQIENEDNNESEHIYMLEPTPSSSSSRSSTLSTSSTSSTASSREMDVEERTVQEETRTNGDILDIEEVPLLLRAIQT